MSLRNFQFFTNAPLNYATLKGGWPQDIIESYWDILRLWETNATSIKGIQSFLGNASFYQRFIKDFSKISKPLLFTWKRHDI